MRSDAYIENMVKTASPAKLVELLYMKAIEVIDEAMELTDEKKYTEANEKLKRAQDIIMELNLSLDMEKGGQIAQNLRALYNYMFQRLVEANVRKDKEIMKEVKGYLEELLDVWREVLKKAGNTVEISKGSDKPGLDLTI